MPIICNRVDQVSNFILLDNADTAARSQKSFIYTYLMYYTLSGLALALAMSDMGRADVFDAKTQSVDISCKNQWPNNANVYDC